MASKRPETTTIKCRPSIMTWFLNDALFWLYRVLPLGLRNWPVEALVHPYPRCWSGLCSSIENSLDSGLTTLSPQTSQLSQIMSWEDWHFYHKSYSERYPISLPYLRPRLEAIRIRKTHLWGLDHRPGCPQASSIGPQPWFSKAIPILMTAPKTGRK